VRNEIEKCLTQQARLSLALVSKSQTDQYLELNNVNLFWKESLERLLSVESGNDVVLNYTGVVWRDRYNRYVGINKVDEQSEDIYNFVFILLH
jgi:hypothetical protein